MLSRPTIDGKYNSKYSNNNNLVHIVIDDSYSNIDFIQNNLNNVINQINNSYHQNTMFVISLLSNDKIIYNDLLSFKNITFNNIVPSFISKEFNINNIPGDYFENDIYSNIDIFLISDLQSSVIPKSQINPSAKLDNINFFILQNNTNNANVPSSTNFMDFPPLCPCVIKTF